MVLNEFVMKETLAIDTHIRLFRKTSTTQIDIFVSMHLVYLKSQSLKIFNKETP